MGRGRRAEGEVRAEETEREKERGGGGGGGGWRRRRGGLVRLRMEVVYACAG